MAEAANSDSVNRGDDGPDLATALSIILSIHAEQGEVSSVAQSIAQSWKRVEEQCGLNRQGAKHFAAILKKPVDNRKDEFRTFILLAQHAGWFDWFQDLVDLSQLPNAKADGTPRQPPQAPAAPTKAKEADPPPPPPPSDDSDLADAGGPDPDAAGDKAEAAPAAEQPKKRGRAKLSIVSAMEESRAHLTGGKPH